MVLCEIEWCKVGFIGCDLNIGKNVMFDCVIFVWISGGGCYIGLWELFDVWCVVSICYEEFVFF